ncbi:MAG: hypothetical protein ACE37J_17815 [Pikeienuella sp.]|uniref:hypothetical protein n=1 Tax=Pikeienuella sp. TaxID=2831957 RepID=UPI00391B1C20
MRPRLVIHIGMHKTGSSSIQHYLSRNRRLLRLLGVLYPDSIGADGRRQPKHAALFDAISHEADHGRPHPAYGPSAALVETLARRIETSGARVAVLSAEGFSGPKPDFARALAPLAARFDARVVVFLRRPDLWAESFHRQMVMSRQVREARPLRTFLASPEMQAHLDWPRIIGWWREAFGAGAVRILAFAPGAGGPAPARAFAAAASLPRPCLLLPHLGAHRNKAPDEARLLAALRKNASAAGAREAAPDSALLPLSEEERSAFLAIHAPGWKLFTNAGK